MRDLFDSMERENDLKEQLRFTEEETKMMRKKLAELEEENEGLNIQIRKMSRNNKRRELREKEKFVKDGDDSDGDSTGGDIDVRIQCDLLEQELSVTRKKLSDGEHVNERLRAEVSFLQEKVEEKTQLLCIKPEPSSPNAYYEDKIKQMTVETDDLKWKIIDKEREIERLCAQMNFIQHSHRQLQQGKLKKSRSLDSEAHVELCDLRRQLEHSNTEHGATKERLAQLVVDNEKLEAENKRLQKEGLCRIPSIKADDAAVENIELKDKVKKLEEDNHLHEEYIKTLTESLQSLTKESRPRPPSEEGSIPGSRNADTSRDQMIKHLDSLQTENSELRRKMAELEGFSSRGGSGTSSLRETDDAKSDSKDMEPEDMSRLQLVEKVLDLEDEILDLKSAIKHKDLARGDVDREVESLKQHLEDDEGEWRRKERDMVEEMEMLHEKNSVLSNLLEIVTERADRAEAELEAFMKESTSDRSASQVSALSNASVGSDDVFLSPPPCDKKPTVDRDWDRQMKKRVDSLERLLAEERLKVATAEKKLMLVTRESISTAMSDDSKLHLREKELLQHELVESQKHLKIASDQMRGLKERLYTVEEEHTRLKVDYGRVCEQLDQIENNSFDSDKTPEGDIESEEINTHPKKSLPPLKIPHRQSSLDAMTVEQKCAMYKLKAEELQYKVEEINDIWRSKSAASEEEKVQLEKEVKQKEESVRVLREMLEKVKDEMCEKEKVITLSESAIQEKGRAISRRDEILQEQDEALRQRDTDFTTIMLHIQQRDDNIRELREAVRNRDERLKEKDDIMCKLNSSLDSRQRDVKMLSDKISDVNEQLNEKEAVISVLNQQISHNTSILKDTEGETDVEKVNTRLTEALKARQNEIECLRVDKRTCLKELETSRKALDDGMLTWEKEKGYLDSQLKVADEKMKLYESLPSMNKDEIAKAMESDAQVYFQEKERLGCELSNARKEKDTAMKQLQTVNSKLETDVIDASKQLRLEMELTTRQQQDIDRLTAQAELAYRLQQDERVIRAEYLAMKVRYETRFEKMWKDYSRMLVTIEKLQKERDLDKAIIQGMQRGMAQLRDSYSADGVRWEDEKARLERQIKEIDETRVLANGLKTKIQDLKEKISEQDRSRTDMVNKFATERSSWDMERANFRSKLNQMEEKLSITNRAQTRAKDVQSHMQLAWDSERAEKRQLLEKAHNLALDLQEQLKSRDNTYSQERRTLLQQVEDEIQVATRNRKERDVALAEMEVCGKKLVRLEQQRGEEAARHVKTCEEKEGEKRELIKRMAELHHKHAQEARKISDILSNLVRLRELGSLITEREHVKGNKANLDGRVVNCMKEAILDVNTATEHLTALTSPQSQSSSVLRRSLSISEIDLLKEEITGLQQAAESEEEPRDRIRAPVSQLQKSSTFDASNTSPAVTPTGLAPGSSYTGHSLGLGLTTPAPNSRHRSVSPSFMSIPTFSKQARNERPKTLQKSISVDAASPREPVSAYHSEHVIKEHKGGSQQFLPQTTPTYLSPKVGSLDRVSPRSARRKFFEERPVSDVGFLSWPERRPQRVSGHQKQSSLPDPSEVRKVAEEDHTMLVKPEDKPVSKIKSSHSWDEKMHHRIVNIDNAEHTIVPTVSAPTASEQSSKLSAKEKRRFFKKSTSLESGVGSSLARMGTQVMPVAAPTGFTPTDILATVRGKLKLPFRKSKESKVAASDADETHTASQLSPSSSTTQSGRGRDERTSDKSDKFKPDSRWRSKSAERPRSTKSALEQSESTLDQQMWKFNETAV